MSQLSTCRIHFVPPQDAARRAEPVTIGVAVPRGRCREISALSLRRPDGSAQALQVRSLEQWPDGSHRWLLLDFQVTSSDAGWVELAFDRQTAPAPAASTSLVTTDAAVTMTTGGFSVVVAQGSRVPFIEVWKDQTSVLDPTRTQLVVRSGGADCRAVIDAVEVEERGPLRAAVHLRGRVPDLGLDLSCRIEMFAGLAQLRVRVTLHNPRAAAHPGGFWELGDSGSVRIERVAWAFGAAGDAPLREIRCAPEAGSALQSFAVPFRLHQESSGKPNWRSPVHVDASGQVPLRHSGYRLTAGDVQHAGGQASPVLELAAGAQTIAVTSRLFWQLFPKAYAIDADGTLHVELLPEGAEVHELQGGERFSHELVVAFDGGAGALEWVRSPVTPIVDPAWWEAAGEVPNLGVVTNPDAPYERLVRGAIDGNDTFEAKRDRIDEYGWRHYGDLYADHENGPASDRPPIVSHYNNQYDGLAGMLAQLMRSGDSRWWHLARDLAAHVANIDIYWTDADKSAYNGGLFWHTYHYVDAGRSSHRTYPRADGVPGGGPSVEHNYSTGLLWHHFMTGDPVSRDAVLRLARWTVEMDDGSRTPFRLLSVGPTGYVSATGGADYHGPGRGPANALHTLLNAFRLTGDRAWVAKVDELIRRCIHPTDDLAARNLLDAERRWYYTVFLQALGRYLGFKTTLGEQDAMWHYARASLLHYARWMTTHEYPYLDKPEILEYPTETWAAQDMRKCEVFDLASEYAETSDERAQFVERARFFFDSSIATLHKWPTRTWARPVVLMLSYGFRHLWYEAHRAGLPLLSSSSDRAFGRPVRFTPQKAVAIHRAKFVVASGAALAAALVLSWYLS